MNPAYSVIFFTTASGAGYGMLALLGLVGFNHGQASSLAFAVTTVGIGLALVTLGLLSSTFHLGHPERAWRAFSQWRSSWLSREGVLAVLAYPVVLAFAAGWSGLVDATAAIAPLGIAVLVFCMATVFSTAKIYATLKTIPAWHNPLTVPVYLAFAIATGAALLGAVSLPFGRFQVFQAGLAGVALLLTLALKWFYWRSIDMGPRPPTTSQATGLGREARQWEVPHTNTNFIQKEMGFVVARKHAVKLRGLVLLLLFLAAIACLFAVVITPVFVLLAALLAAVAAVTERWLFFAEARHVVMAFYQA